MYTKFLVILCINEGKHIFVQHYMFQILYILYFQSYIIDYV